MLFLKCSNSSFLRWNEETKRQSVLNKKRQSKKGERDFAWRTEMSYPQCLAGLDYISQRETVCGGYSTVCVLIACQGELPSYPTQESPTSAFF